jgi:acetyltransferase-like isoleucine patch superfamily enzyme
MIRKTLQHLALEKGKCVGLWRKFCSPNMHLWAEYLKRHGRLHRIGKDCAISRATVFTDPEMVSLGNNVWLSDVWICNHDGSAIMLGQAFGLKLDSVGPVKIHDNVFVGNGVMILPGVTIGENSVIGAGSIVTRDIPPNSIAVGNPARVIRSTTEQIERMKAKLATYPWRDLIEKREGGFDPKLEPELLRQRRAYFFPEEA